MLDNYHYDENHMQYSVLDKQDKMVWGDSLHVNN